MPSTKEKEKENRVRIAYNTGKLLVQILPKTFGTNFLESKRTCRDMAKLIRTARDEKELKIGINCLTSAIKYALFDYDDKVEGNYGLPPYENILLTPEQIKEYNSRKYKSLKERNIGLPNQSSEELRERIFSNLEKMIRGYGNEPWTDQDKEELWNLTATRGFYNKKTYVPNYEKIAEIMERTPGSIKSMYQKLKEKYGIPIKSKIDWREEIEIVGTSMPLIIYIEQLSRLQSFQGRKKNKTTILYQKLSQYLENNLRDLSGKLTPDKIRKALENNKEFISQNRKKYIPRLINLERILEAA